MLSIFRLSVWHRLTTFIVFKYCTNYKTSYHQIMAISRDLSFEKCQQKSWSGSSKKVFNTWFLQRNRSHEINFSKKRTEERVYTLKITLVCKILTWLTNQFVYYWMGLKCWTPCSIIFRSVETILHPFDFLTKPWQILKTNIYETTFTWIAINYQF